MTTTTDRTAKPVPPTRPRTVRPPAVRSQPQQRLPFRTAGDLADVLDPGVLAVMQTDAQQLAGRAGTTGGAWQALADTLGEACALAEHTAQQAGRAGHSRRR